MAYRCSRRTVRHLKFLAAMTRSTFPTAMLLRGQAAMLRPQRPTSAELVPSHEFRRTEAPHHHWGALCNAARFSCLCRSKGFISSLTSRSRSRPLQPNQRTLCHADQDSRIVTEHISRHSHDVRETKAAARAMVSPMNW
jgi:hypothetical protein